MTQDLSAHTLESVRQNMTVMSFFIIIYFVGDGYLIDDVIKLPLVNIEFLEPKRLIYVLLCVMGWWVYRYITLGSYNEYVSKLARARLDSVFLLGHMYMDEDDTKTLGSSKNECSLVYDRTIKQWIIKVEDTESGDCKYINDYSLTPWQLFVAKFAIHVTNPHTLTFLLPICLVFVSSKLLFSTI